MNYTVEIRHDEDNMPYLAIIEREEDNDNTDSDDSPS